MNNNQAMFESLKELGEINAKLYTRLAEQQQSLLADAAEMGNTWVSRATDVRGMEDVIKSGFDFATACSEKLIAAGTDAQGILSTSRDEYQAWMQNGVKKANFNFKTPAPKAAPTKQAA